MLKELIWSLFGVVGCTAPKKKDVDPCSRRRRGFQEGVGFNAVRTNLFQRPTDTTTTLMSPAFRNAVVVPLTTLPWYQRHITEDA